MLLGDEEKEGYIIESCHGAIVQYSKKSNCRRNVLRRLFTMLCDGARFKN